VSVVSEQAPNPESRVTLSPRRDALGQPLARLDWRLAEIDRTSWLRGLDALAREVARAGLGRLVLPPSEEAIGALERVRGGRHHMGTTRMSDDPRGGVVDRHTRVHGVENLYVAGSSVFPAAGHANPTLTLIALAIRLAEHLQSRCI
jgi:choline dehydrogenase-like flavoprotein